MIAINSPRATERLMLSSALAIFTVSSIVFSRGFGKTKTVVRGGVLKIVQPQQLAELELLEAAVAWSFIGSESKS